MRFGSKGSLSVHLTGSKAGTFYDFEEQVGGGPLRLIERTLSCTPSQARKYAQEFLGEAPNLPIPTHFAHKKILEEQEFVSLKPDPNLPPPPLKKLSKGLAYYYQEKMRHTYRDTEGNTLFHILRLENDEGKKTILPVSYGYFQGGEPTWTLRGYQALPRPLYNLHLLKEQPNARVLIVEGEKAADHANKLFPNTISLTWSGGAKAADKTDWSPLFMRDVIIWPDNDKAGYEAADTICQLLRKVGIKSLHTVDKQLLVTLPPKWDLADPLPQKEQFIKDALLRASERGVGLPTFLSLLKAHSLGVDTQTALKALSHTEERLRPALSQDHTPPEIRSHILKSATQTLLSTTPPLNNLPEATKEPQQKALELENSV
ncbi:MAG: hypothetical protein K940chlam9_01542 [Chlamydiae bacterium]|nr:hypothetical protein [Chlamydiota bacterium]